MKQITLQTYDCSLAHVPSLREDHETDIVGHGGDPVEVLVPLDLADSPLLQQSQFIRCHSLTW